MAQVNTRKRGKTWEYRFEAASINGKRSQISKGGFRTKASALEAGTAALAEYNRSGLAFKPTQLSVADYLDFWFDNYCKMNLKYNTQLGYLRIMENYLKSIFGKYRLNALNPTVIQDFALTWDDIDLQQHTLTVNKQVVKRNFGADIRQAARKKSKRELKSSWYLASTKTATSNRTIKFGETLYQALRQEKVRQMENEIKYAEYYTIHVLKKELDEKMNLCFVLFRSRNAYILTFHASS